jgi:hypothetical protein
LLNSSKYGINIDIRSFFGLLRKYSDLGLVVKNDKNIKEVIEEEVEWYGASVKKYTEDEKIDGIMALASLMNSRENIFAFGVDNDSTNVFIRGLTRQAQRRMSLIVANGSKTTGEYDACMEGEGDVYTHMISNCRGYKCETPEYQAAVIERAYQDMTANKHHVIQ